MSDNRHPPFVSPKGFHDDMDHNGGSSSCSSGDEQDADAAAEIAEAARAEAHERLRRLHVAVAATQAFIQETAHVPDTSAECNDQLSAASSRLRELEGTPEPAATQAGAAMVRSQDSISSSEHSEPSGGLARLMRVYSDKSDAHTCAGIRDG